MQKVRVHNFHMSLDGYAAGLNEHRDKPFGDVDNDFAAAGDSNIGATIMGGNTFAEISAKWDEGWNAWWGEAPPDHHPVFVLTHHQREPIEMSGGTTFHFATEGIEAALAQACEAANGADVRIGGGPSTIQQYLRARLVDEMHFVIVPILMGAGERLFDNLHGAIAGYECVELVASPPGVVHVRIARSPTGGG